MALAFNTRVPTKHGWTTVAELRAGDVVLDEVGEPARVRKVSAPADGGRCITLSVADPSTAQTWRVTCDEDQAWPVVSMADPPARWRDGEARWLLTDRVQARDLAGGATPASAWVLPGCGGTRTEWLAVARVTSGPSVPTVKVAVDSPRSVFLVSPGMLPTCS